MTDPNWFTPTEPQLFFSRKDLQDPRLGENVVSEPFAFSELNTQSNSNEFYILGYPDDEGILKNGGRPGSSQAPFEIRKYFYKMTPDVQTQIKPKFYDLGNLNIQNIPLLDRHERARECVRQLNEKSKKWISLGGGHDYGYSDACGFLDVYKNEALVINIDSHLDVRPMTEVPHSGTPFFRMLKEFSKEVLFFEVGIQNHCNSASHLAWAQEQKAQVVFQNELQTLEALNRLFSKLPPSTLPNNKKLKVFISLDIDAFSNNEAPGCSQSWATGLSLFYCLELFKYLQNHYEVRGLGIYEVSPPLDFDHKTSKLAALIMHHFIYGFIKK